MTVRLSVFFSFGDMLSFTLTAFVELMDHGIVSWDTFSVAFIKKVMPKVLLSAQIPSSLHSLLCFKDLVYLFPLVLCVKG